MVALRAGDGGERRERERGRDGDRVGVDAAERHLILLRVAVDGDAPCATADDAARREWQAAGV